MEFTRRYVVVAGLTVALAGTAVVVDRPFPLLGAVGIGAWLLAAQYRFVRRAGLLAASVDVDVRVAEDPVTADHDVPVDLVVTTDGPAPLAVTVEPPVPTAARTTTPAEPFVLDRGSTVAECSYAVRFPVAGTYRFDRATLTVEDEAGYFAATVAAGNRPSVDVEPGGPRSLHIGRAGERIASTFGDDPGPRATRGIEPEEVRPYQEGDRAAHIDWRATARLNELHVREFSLDVSGRDAAMIVDRRSRLAAGPPGETMLDYARAVGLAYLASAARSATRFSLYFVADEEVRPAGELGDDAGGYFWLRRTLEGLTADAAGEGRTASTPTATAAPRTVVARRLADGDTAFERGLGPFFDRRSGRPRVVGSAPLLSGVRTWLAESSPPRETVVVTDDADRTVLRQAIAEATGDGGRVTAMLLPRVLFERRDPAELDAAYDRYRSFEAFRRGLDARPDVTALEVGPGDRIDAILAAGVR